MITMWLPIYIESYLSIYSAISFVGSLLSVSVSLVEANIIFRALEFVTSAFKIFITNDHFPTLLLCLFLDILLSFRRGSLMIGSSLIVLH